MPTKTFRYTSVAMSVLEKAFRAKFYVTGLENLPQHPVMFVANHFTRAETFFIPYLIDKYTKRQVRSLAHDSLYSGMLGKFLESAGTISTGNPNRDNIILKDLIEGSHDWLIYPEGSMIKTKEIKFDDRFFSYTPSRIGPVRTGSAVLALKSELYRLNIIDAYKKHQTHILEDFRKSLGVSYQDYFNDIQTHIVPLNITYYPIRPGKNKIQELVHRVIKKLPRQIMEEIEMEGNFLLDAEINITFGEPINVGNYIKPARHSISQLPIIKDDTKNNLIIKYLRSHLTNNFMTNIYSNLQINLDHIFIATLNSLPHPEVEISHLKKIIYLSAVMIQKCGKYHINHSVFEANLFKIFLDKPHKEFDELLELSVNSGLISYNGFDKIIIKKSAFTKQYDFHEVRLKNPLYVVHNEFLLLSTANSIIRRNVKISRTQLRHKVYHEILDHDVKNFEADYQIYFDKDFSKEKSCGRPFALDENVKAGTKVKKTGIIITHGYKSSPREVEPLAKFLNGFGFKVYVPRLKGHGTAPINLKDVTWEDWYYSVERGYAALQNICSKIIMIGFSTGGLLSLVSCARKNSHSKIAGVVTINAALKLLDAKARLVPGINAWNELLETIHLDKGKFEYVDDQPENPHINYSRNYLRGVVELEKLMEICDINLKDIKTKALIIQAKKDPVVNPISSQIIFDKIQSPEKKLVEVDFDNHVIINGPRQEEVFEQIKNFILNR